MRLPTLPLSLSDNELIHLLIAQGTNTRARRLESTSSRQSSKTSQPSRHPSSFQVLLPPFAPRSTWLLSFGATPAPSVDFPSESPLLTQLSLLASSTSRPQEALLLRAYDGRRQTRTQYLRTPRFIPPLPHRLGVRLSQQVPLCRPSFFPPGVLSQYPAIDAPSRAPTTRRKHSTPSFVSLTFPPRPAPSRLFRRALHLRALPPPALFPPPQLSLAHRPLALAASRLSHPLLPPNNDPPFSFDQNRSHLLALCQSSERPLSPRCI